MTNKKLPIKVEIHFGSGSVWVQATASQLVLYDSGLGPESEEALRVSVASRAEKKRVIDSCFSLAAYLASTLDAEADESNTPISVTQGRSGSGG